MPNSNDVDPVVQPGMIGQPMNLHLSLTFFGVLLSGAIQTEAASAPFAQLDPPNTTTGYLARLLINETPFPGERAYESEVETREGMLAVLWVLHSRIHDIPKRYTQREVAGVQ